HRRRVAPSMVEVAIVIAEEPGVGGHGEDQMGPRREQGEQAADLVGRAIEVLEDIEEHRELERRLASDPGEGRGMPHRGRTTAGEAPRLVVEFDGADATEGAQHGEVAPGTRSEFEEGGSSWQR